MEDLDTNIFLVLANFLDFQSILSYLSCSRKIVDALNSPAIWHQLYILYSLDSFNRCEDCSQDISWESIDWKRIVILAKTRQRKFFEEVFGRLHKSLFYNEVFAKNWWHIYHPIHPLLDKRNATECFELGLLPQDHICTIITVLLLVWQGLLPANILQPRVVELHWFELGDLHRFRGRDKHFETTMSARDVSLRNHRAKHFFEKLMVVKEDNQGIGVKGGFLKLRSN